MKKSRLPGASCAAILVVTSGVAQAALIDRGGGFIYDTVLDITWTQNANINGSAYQGTQANWAASLSLFDSVRNVTWDDWRLPSMDLNMDGVVDCSLGTTTELACRDNELGYMYHQNHITAASPGLFTSLQAGPYWSSTLDTADPDNFAYRFNFTGGGFGDVSKNLNSYAWAVRDGDVAAVPIPAAVWLFGSGMLGLIGISRRRKAA